MTHPAPQPALQLFAFDTPNARKVSIALEEMALPYTVQVVDITQGEQHAPAFVAVSPNHKIPALVDPHGPGGQPVSLFESGAILIYLAEKTGQFMPHDPRRRLQALQWLMFQMGGFGPMPGQVHHFLGLADEADRRYGLQRYMAETRRLYGVMDAHLAEHEYFADELSIADFAIAGWVWRHPRHQVDLADFAQVQRWWQALQARPGVQRGLAVALRR
ncbi:MAG: glutathione S-transferase [Burkholderiales bacterium RIFCSPHIGHO2_12_FULL_69_20]|nr:MAG: glutathione S-transferase [Burkholderiales bacterium RIFCSPHIGHO2_12_FULL_69_20]